MIDYKLANERRTKRVIKQITTFEAKYELEPKLSGEYYKEFVETRVNNFYFDENKGFSIRFDEAASCNSYTSSFIDDCLILIQTKWGYIPQIKTIYC